jgi:hypothetical protein
MHESCSLGSLHPYQRVPDNKAENHRRIFCVRSNQLNPAVPYGIIPFTRIPSLIPSIKFKSA